jgi:hypothetical protein
MEEPAMSLSAWEQQALESIKDGLARSDPQLAALLTTLPRPALDREIPAQEKIPAASRPTILRSLRRPRRPLDDARRGLHSMLGRVNLQFAMMLLWLMVAAVLVTVALLLSRGGSSQGTCPGSWPVLCSHSLHG